MSVNIDYLFSDDYGITYEDAEMSKRIGDGDVTVKPVEEADPKNARKLGKNLFILNLCEKFVFTYFTEDTVIYDKFVGN